MYINNRVKYMYIKGDIHDPIKPEAMSISHAE